MLNESEEILVLVDEAHRSHTRTLHRNLRKALPNAAIIGFTGTPILARRRLRPARSSASSSTNTSCRTRNSTGRQCRSSTKGRTADGMVKDAPGLDELFEDMFRDYTPDELAVIKAKYATEGDVLEAPMLIEQKARDMLRHYVERGAAGGIQGPGRGHQPASRGDVSRETGAGAATTGGGIGALPATHARASRKRDRDSLTQHTQFLVRAHANCPSFARWRSPPYSPAITMTRSRGGTGRTRTSRRNTSDASSANSRRTKPRRRTRCPFWSSTTCSLPASTRRWSKCCTSTGRSLRTICCKPSRA